MRRKRDERACPGCGAKIETQSGYCRPCAAKRTREWRTMHPPTEEQRRRGIARSILNVYVKRGKEIRLPCDVCDRTPAEGHHLMGYEHPLIVRWLCRYHHRAEHKRMKEQAA